jgi:hypothetical protein
MLSTRAHSYDARVRSLELIAARAAAEPSPAPTPEPETVPSGR